MTELRTAYHESAHAVVAFRLAQPIRLVSVRPGETFAGIMLGGSSASLDSVGFDAFRPGIVQPARVRRRIEADICVSLAGQMGADLLWRDSGYVPTRGMRLRPRRWRWSSAGSEGRTLSTSRHWKLTRRRCPATTRQRRRQRGRSPGGRRRRCSAICGRPPIRSSRQTAATSPRSPKSCTSER